MQSALRFIAKAISGGINFYACRMPGGDSAIQYGASRELTQGLAEGFVFAPFEKHRPFTICTELSDVNDLANLDSAELEADFIADADTEIDDYKNAVNAVSAYHREHGGKTVLSTVITGEYHFAPGELFEHLCNTRQDAFVFIFHAAGYGLWIGASPELLLRKHGSAFSTMALAGTRPASEANLEWDAKNVHEQQLVTEYIIDIFSRSGLKISVGETYTKTAGNVCHICTPIDGVADNNADTISLLMSLSPTPALCGSNYDDSLQLIKQYERHRRILYGGYVGQVHGGGDVDLFVNLRSLCADKNRYCVFAGGGITGDSDPDAEWVETRRKAKPLLDAIRDLENKQI